MSHVVAVSLIFAVCAVALAPLAKGPQEKDGPFETFVGFVAIILYCGCLGGALTGAFLL